MPATFQDNEVTSGLKDKRKLSAYLDTLVDTHLEGIKKVKLNYICCNDEYLLTINKQFLNHDTLTDIITFDLSETDAELVGEIYISVDRVKENAAKFGVSYLNELHRVIFHGALHLCGYTDKTAADKQEMRRQEDICLAAYLS
ncbi:rRNA maturation RNase YbeY [Flavipsychrobacter stenotrophus]|uniref:Endoribonuclease YbeY n=1 Tax=Flavipsychrobacter stenotrophus TaxID=2077091 RepID=A0A2S7SSI1_9BACT|nr:rRNA maturation RNase YbeY [Flavipsychrobacter stenotrophus]PQJ09882.1 rRNA maturation RNase YbeY [Flavipsychrobacter stenotrophus]